MAEQDWRSVNAAAEPSSQRDREGVRQSLYAETVKSCGQSSGSEQEVVFTGDHQPSVVGVTVEPFDQVRHEVSAHLLGELPETAPH